MYSSQASLRSWAVISNPSRAVRLSTFGVPFMVKSTAGSNCAMAIFISVSLLAPSTLLPDRKSVV